MAAAWPESHSDVAAATFGRFRRPRSPATFGWVDRISSPPAGVAVRSPEPRYEARITIWSPGRRSVTSRSTSDHQGWLPNHAKRRRSPLGRRTVARRWLARRPAKLAFSHRSHTSTLSSERRPGDAQETPTRRPTPTWGIAKVLRSLPRRPGDASAAAAVRRLQAGRRSQVLWSPGLRRWSPQRCPGGGLPPHRAHRPRCGVERHAGDAARPHVTQQSRAARPQPAAATRFTVALRSEHHAGATPGLAELGAK